MSWPVVPSCGPASVAALSKSTVKLPEPWCGCGPGVALPLANTVKSPVAPIGRPDSSQPKSPPSLVTTSLKSLKSKGPWPGPQVQLVASQLMGSKSSVTCLTRSRNTATGRLKATASSTVSPKKDADEPMASFCVTVSWPDIEVGCCDCGEP